MSELKVYHCNEWHNEYTEFYIKSEADKVIAEKDETIDELEERNDELQKATDSAWSKVNAMYDELRRQKYKRCLAMADKCVDLCHKAKNLYRWAEDENLEHHYNHKIEFFARWHQRWLTLAEKFKEAK